jgi:hypothetical protein
MSGATYDNESQDFSYLDDSQMNSSEYAAESNIDPEGSSSSLRDMALPNNTPLPENKYLIITKDSITLTRARSILSTKVYT